MELLFVLVIGAGFGAVLRYTLPQRDTYGALLLPAIGAAVAGIVWVALLWAGLTFDGGWIWLGSLGASLAVTLFTALQLPRSRTAADNAAYLELSGSKA